MLYIFGGKGYKAWNDHTLYSLKTNSSEWVAIPIISDSFPESRINMSMFSFENKLYVFGGIRWRKTLKDFYKFCIKTRSWSNLSKTCENYE